MLSFCSHLLIEERAPGLLQLIKEIRAKYNRNNKQNDTKSSTLAKSPTFFCGVPTVTSVTLVVMVVVVGVGGVRGIT